MSDDLVRNLREARYVAFDECGDYDLAQEAATALTEARAEIEALQGMLSDMEALKNTYRDDCLAAESELSTLRARVREVVGPFGNLAQQYDDTVSDGWVSWAELVADHAWPTETNCRAARQLMEDLK